MLAITGHCNEAWGHYSVLFFIMSDGNVYSSTESFSTGWSVDNTLTNSQRADLLRKYTKPTTVIKESDLAKIYENMVKIDPDAEFKYEDMYCCDAGTSFTYVFVDGKMIKISESGDATGALKDSHAKKADTLISKALAGTGDNVKNHLYSRSESYLATLCAPNAEFKDTRRIITNMDELRQFEKDSGIQLEGTEGFEYFGDPTYDQFGTVCILIEMVSYPDYLKPDQVTADAFIVSDDYVGFAFLEDPQIDISEDAVPSTWYCHIVQLSNYEMSEYEPFLK